MSEKFDRSIDRFILEQHVMRELTDVGGFVQGQSRSPADWIQHALSKSYTPPWFEQVRGQPDLWAFLPAEKKPVPTSIQSKGGEQRRDATPQQKAKCILLELWDEGNFSDGNDPGIASLRSRMIKEFVNKKTPEVSERTIKQWIVDLKKTLAGKLPPAWAVALREKRSAAEAELLPILEEMLKAHFLMRMRSRRL